MSDATLKRPGWPRPAASAAVLRGDSILLVQRGKGGARPGIWSLPGGHIEPGERAADAAAREVQEETGVIATMIGVVGIHDVFIRDATGSLTAHYVIAVHAARYIDGEALATSDAADARFVPVKDLSRYQMTDGAIDLIQRAQALLSGLSP